MHLRTRRGVWQRWLAAAGAWQGWSACPALLGPESGEISIPKDVQPVATSWLAARLAVTLREAATAGGAAVVLDLEPLLGIHVAARLNQLRLANAVLLLPRWPYQEAVLPLDKLMGGLVSQAARLTSGELSHVVFVLDAQRSRPVPHRPAADRRADNRYRLTVADLPNLAALRARGLGRIIKIMST